MAQKQKDMSLEALLGDVVPRFVTCREDQSKEQHSYGHLLYKLYTTLHLKYEG